MGRAGKNLKVDFAPSAAHSCRHALFCHPLPQHRTRDLFDRCGQFFLRPTLVRAGLYRGHPDRLAAGRTRAQNPTALAFGRRSDDSVTTGGPADLDHRRRHRWRAAWLCVVLPAKLLSGQSRRNPDGLARRYVISWRISGRRSGGLVVLQATRIAAGAGRGRHGFRRAARSISRPSCQFRECRALGPSVDRALGSDFPRRACTGLPGRGRALCPPSFATLRGGDGRVDPWNACCFSSSGGAVG